MDPLFKSDVREFERSLLLTIIHNLKLKKLSLQTGQQIVKTYLAGVYTTRDEFIAFLRRLGENFPLVLIAGESIFKMNHEKHTNTLLHSIDTHMQAGDLNAAINTLKGAQQ